LACYSDSDDDVRLEQRCLEIPSSVIRIPLMSVWSRTPTMSTQVLVTKLYLPPPRPRVIHRTRLIERLNEGLHRKLTLVSAPAGFGKTTLVSAWIADSGRPTAWLSLDEGDSDPARFLTYLVAALQTVDATIGEGLSNVLQSPQQPPTESILTCLLNDISALANDITLVLDDYHLIDSPAIDDAITFLIDHLPPQLHLVITTREDPQLPLARMRARGQLTEVRASDLRFTTDEAAAFLNEVMGLDLSAQDVAALETRTEGWIAGLQLAALSMRGRDDVSGFIQAFAGNDRYIVDYLVEEVLQREPDHIRDFLLQTSILDRLSGFLCDAVTGRDESKTFLETLERGNLFVVPLDDKRQWYRYHHLFADVLRAHLVDEHPDQVSALHRRASIWYEQNGDLPAAIHHAFAAEDFARAADLVERSVPAMGRSRQEATLLAWLRALPDEVIRVRPVLSVDYAGTLLQAVGDLEGAEARLRDAERWLDPAAVTNGPSAGMVVGDYGSFRRLPGQIAIYRAGQALIRGDVAETMRYAGQALDLLPVHDDFGRGAATGLLGLAFWTRGDLEAGHRMYTECMAFLQRAGFISDLFGCALVLADIRITQGRLHEAMRTYERALQLAAEHSTAILRGTADMHVGMSELHREWGDLDTAINHVLTSQDLGRHNGLRQNPYRWCVAMAGIREVQGDLDGALDLLLEAERLYVGDFSPNVRPVAALTARMWAARGRLGDALGWAREQGLSAEDDLSYLREFEHITLARVLIARYKSERDDRVIHEAMGLLERLLHAADEGGRTGRVIEILVLQALAREAQGDIPGALGPLERALSLAEPEGYVRTFVGEGAPMARLLSEANAHGLMPNYTGRLLVAFDGVAPTSERIPSQPSVRTAQPLIEPLSQRELQVLQLIAQGLSNHEIGERLFLALSTVKGHNRVIFGKLNVQRRTEAIARARDLGLL
jgi:LuxR family maltose regulon positive regulatory protein